MRRLLCVVLASVMLLGCLSYTAAAEDTPYAGKIVILATGNLRGAVDLYPRIKAAKDEYLAKGAEVILVDTGNFLQGSAAANGDRGFGIYQLMDACGYDVANLGLAEFGYCDATTGYPYHGNVTRYYTQKMLQEGTEALTYPVNADGSKTAVLPAKAPAKFQTVSGGFVDLAGVYSFRSYVEYQTSDGYQLCFLGRTDPAVSDQIQDRFLAVDTEPKAISTEGYDLTVCLSNAEEDAETLGASLMISAPRSAGVFLRAYAYDPVAGTVATEAVQMAASDPVVAAMAAEVKESAKTSLFSSTVTLDGADHRNRTAETNLGDLTTDALCWYAKTYVDGLDPEIPLVAIQNGGNCDQFLYDGDVTETDLLWCLPFSPMGIGVLYVTGQQLLEALEAGTQGETCPGFAQVSGLHYTVKAYEAYDAGAAYGKFYRADSIRRVEITEIGGKPFDPNAVYAVVADNYVLNGNDTYYIFKEAKAAENAVYLNNGGGMKTRDIVALYVQQVLGGTLDDRYAQPDNRITVITQKPVAFTDLKDGAFYTDAVAWAVNHDVTTGTDATHFSPDADCTRAQVVTFLWRANGAPAPSSEESPFADVTGGFYYKAVLWAVENGVTTGIDSTHFAPNSTCTRGQVVTFLWRAKGSNPPAATESPFSDVTGGYCYNAVLWAVEHKITTGMDATHFAPESACTRGHVVTFLYRAEKGD